ncbi:MAG: alpha/beta hydrolase [Bacteroidetes bacterium]|nr:alpha/beta hydrolase [Bacteroidota bacterium]
MAPPSETSRSIVFVTGTFIGNTCWDEWKKFFERKGYHCLAPAWPFKLASAEELRNSHPDEAIASTRLTDLLDYFTAIINALPEKPILIGHSLGGLIVQLLLQRGLGIAGVAMHSFPPRGLGYKLSFLRNIWKAAGLFGRAGESYMIPFQLWKYTIANGMTFDQRKELYYLYAIPESRQVMRDIFRPVAKIDFRGPHPPLLFTAGGRDRLIPASLNFRNYKKYRMSNSIAHYKEFKDRNHLVFGNPEWREDADFILYWLEDINGNVFYNNQ